MSQCEAAYFDGTSSVCCQLLDGHEGPHQDAAGDWGAKEPLHIRRERATWNKAIRAAAEAISNIESDGHLGTMIDKQHAEETVLALLQPGPAREE
jgi:hypothetical protein